MQGPRQSNGFNRNKQTLAQIPFFKLPLSGSFCSVVIWTVFQSVWKMCGNIYLITKVVVCVCVWLSQQIVHRYVI